MDFLHRYLNVSISSNLALTEQRISNKVAQLLDKRVNVELGRVKKDIDSRLNTFKDTMRE